MKKNVLLSYLFANPFMKEVQELGGTLSNLTISTQTELGNGTTAFFMEGAIHTLVTDDLSFSASFIVTPKEREETFESNMINMQLIVEGAKDHSPFPAVNLLYRDHYGLQRSTNGKTQAFFVHFSQKIVSLKSTDRQALTETKTKDILVDPNYQLSDGYPSDSFKKTDLPKIRTLQSR